MSGQQRRLATFCSALLLTGFVVTGCWGGDDEDDDIAYCETCAPTRPDPVVPTATSPDPNSPDDAVGGTFTGSGGFDSRSGGATSGGNFGLGGAFTGGSSPFSGGSSNFSGGASGVGIGGSSPFGIGGSAAFGGL